jgi:hypothetical protein
MPGRLAWAPMLGIEAARVNQWLEHGTSLELISCFKRNRHMAAIEQASQLAAREVAFQRDETLHSIRREQGAGFDLVAGIDRESLIQFAGDEVHLFQVASALAAFPPARSGHQRTAGKALGIFDMDQDALKHGLAVLAAGIELRFDEREFGHLRARPRSGLRTCARLCPGSSAASFRTG